MRRVRLRFKRYVGNHNTTEVHDLDQEDTAPNGCQIDEIIGAGNNVTFDPDTIVEAYGRGYDSCAKCLGGSIR